MCIQFLVVFEMKVMMLEIVFFLYIKYVNYFSIFPGEYSTYSRKEEMGSMRSAQSAGNLQFLKIFLLYFRVDQMFENQFHK